MKSAHKNNPPKPVEVQTVADDPDENEEKPSFPREFQDFDLSIFDGIYYVDWDHGVFPVVLNPYNIFRLYEIEGIPPMDLMEFERQTFRKAVLIRSGARLGRTLTREDGCEILPEWCWIEEPFPDTNLDDDSAANH